MTQFHELERGAPHSLAPIQIEGESADVREPSKLRDGSGPRLLVLIALVGAATLGGVKLLDVLDESQAHASAAAQLARSDAEPRDAFMRCALPSYVRSQSSAPDALREQLERTTARLQRGYGQVLAGCSTLLANFRHAAQDVRAPADVKAEVGAVSLAASQLATAWSGLQNYLTRTDTTYDPAQAALLIDEIDVGWQDYLRARDGAKAALVAKR